jgi:excisionase family DNA binding protein
VRLAHLCFSHSVRYIALFNASIASKTAKPDMEVTTQDSAANVQADELIEKPETAKRLKVGTRTLDEWMRQGRVPYLKFGKSVRFRWPDVVAHLDERCRVH